MDLEATLKNFRAEEAQYLEIMRRAGTIKDTLEVAARLSDVRGRIERLQAQLNVLSHQTEMASLAISLRTQPAPQPAGFHWRPLRKIRLAFWDAASDFAEYVDTMIALLFRMPVVLLWTATVVGFLTVGWRSARWFWKKFFRTSTATA